ncbi:hypothetical protein Dimus_012110 [Dionaea muscipula]
MTRSLLEIERRILRYLHGRETRTRLLEIHAHFLRHGLHESNQVLSHFVSVCRSHGKMAYAELIFQQALHPNRLLFNSMIKGYSLSGPFDRALILFSLMRDRDIWADEYTFAPLIKACSNLCDLRAGQCVHGQILRLGFGCFSSIGIGMVELYANFTRTREAMKVFDNMPLRSDIAVVVRNLMINGFCKSGDIEMGLHFFRQMGEPRSLVTWNLLMSWLAKNGRDTEALELFHEMKADGFRPDAATVVTMLPVCARLGAVDVGKWLVLYAAEFSNHLFLEFITVGNSIVNFYCKCGDLVSAERIFRDMPQKNVTSWNTMISGLAFNGKAELGIDLFDQMVNTGVVTPDDSSFVAVLTCCAHGKLLQRGRDYFDSMTRKYGGLLRPKLEHYGCMVDLLGRVGCLAEAYELIKTMPMRPNATLWGSLLSASRTHGDVEAAECAIKELIHLEPWNSGNYVLLSNLYAEGGRWEEVEDLRVLMKENSINKAAGQSIVGLG